MALKKTTQTGLAVTISTIATAVVLTLNPGWITSTEIVGLDSAYKQIEAEAATLRLNLAEAATTPGAEWLRPFEAQATERVTTIADFRELLTENYLFDAQAQPTTDPVGEQDPPVIDPPVIDPPVIDPPVIDPPVVSPGAPLDTVWKTDSKTIPGIKQAKSYIGIWSNNQMKAMDAVAIPTETLKGVWRGYNTGAIDPSTGQGGTLWGVRAFDVAGLVDGVELWDIGDFVKGREGHGLYLNVAPHKNLTIRNYKCFKNGAQAIQREFRLHETIMPEAVWKSAVGTFLVEDCEFAETGLIDDATGGESVRASWVMTLYGTGQHTIVRRVKHTNYHSPAPHEGTLFVGFGQSGFRTPSVLVESCDWWTEDSDRADAFFQGCDAVVVRTTHLRGEDDYIDVVNDCKKFTISDMPEDVLVRLKNPGPQMHGAPYKTHLVKAGEKLELVF